MNKLTEEEQRAWSNSSIVKEIQQQIDQEIIKELILKANENLPTVPLYQTSKAPDVFQIY